MTGFDGLVPRLPAKAWVLLAGDALSALGSGLTLPFFLVYLHRVRGIDLGVAGLVMSAIAVAGVAGNLAGGVLTDRFGARRALVSGLVLAAAGSAAIAGVHGTWQAFAAAGVYGLGMAIIWPALDSLLATVVASEQRSQVFALRHATLNTGFALGGLASALVVGFSSPGRFVLIYLLDAASFLGFALLVWRFAEYRAAQGPQLARTAVASQLHRRSAPNEPVKARTVGYRSLLADRVFVRIWLLTFLLVAAGYAQYHAAFPGYATSTGGLSARALGVAFAANTCAVVLLQLPVLRAMSGRRRTRGLALSAGFVAAAWAVTVSAGLLDAGVAAYAAAMVLVAAGETLLTPTLPAMVNDIAPDAARGRYNGAYSLAWTTGFIIGPAIAGITLGAGLGTGLFLGLISALVVAASMALRLERRLPAAANLVGEARPAATPTEKSSEPAPLPALAEVGA
jgi:MFS family permease